ncbi:MAG: hypothetical protein ACOCRX_02525 [Candidatus Woesearchaeota archaeon]
MFKNKTLLIIGSYPSEDGSIIAGTFVKEQADRLKQKNFFSFVFSDNNLIII